MHTISLDRNSANSARVHQAATGLNSSCDSVPEHTEHLEKINSYYESPAVQLFEQLTGQQIHLGYWDLRYPSVSLAQAARRLTSIIINLLKPGPESHLLDIGCGSGIPALEIMQQTGCRVDGITINYAQQQNALSAAKQAGLQAKSHFVLGDAAALSYPDDYFDYALLLESIHHIGHEQAIGEASRVLKPGGEILIADALVMSETGQADHQKWLAETFVSKSQLNRQDICNTLILNGFSRLEVIDLSQAIQPTWAKLKSTTRDHKTMITQTHGIEMYQQMLDFWGRIDDIWSHTAHYLLFKAYKL